MRGGHVAHFASLVFGLFLFAAGIVALLESKLGLSPWDVLNQGIAKHTALSFGLANIAVGLVVLVLAWALGAPPGLGTVANAVLIGLFIDGLVRLGPVESLAGTALGVRAALIPLGIALMGVGSAFYIGAAYGAGPRDSLMLVLSRRTGRRIGLVRAGLEASALIAGFALGGTVGIGTLAFALLIGPSVEASFWLLSKTPLAA
ncbi:MAG: hypothetical protein M3540_06535 [Actinomycetota bacterium]|nr:hypothetical protein [Actinomycetota bacterium]